MILWKYLFLMLIVFCSNQAKGQNCTVNAGLDGGTCLVYNFGVNYVYDLFTLNGNSAGNVNTAPNLLWQLVSAPTGAVVTFSNANGNTTIVRGKTNELPSGNYVFRLGINCLSGERVYDSVAYSIKNIGGFNLVADKSWSSMCANSNDSIHLVGRPLREGEVFKLTGRNISLINSNLNATLNTDVYGPTADSVRCTIKKSNADFCTLDYYSLVFFSIRNGNCAINSRQPSLLIPDPSGEMGVSKVYISKTGIRNNVDTISCITGQYFVTQANNICLKGGQGNFTDFYNNFSVVTLSGSGTVSPTNFSVSGVSNTIANKWDTVTRNTLHVYEVTYGSNGCYPTFKDTIKIFFKSATPVSTGAVLTSSYAYCHNAADFPLSNNLKFPLPIRGLLPPNCRLVSSVNGPSTVSVLNPYSTDSVTMIGNKIPGQYAILTMFVDTISGCTTLSSVISIVFSKKAILPILRDTAVCLSSNYYLNIRYNPGSFGLQQYGFAFISGPPNNYINQVFSYNDSTLSFTISQSSTPPGIYSIRAYPIAGSGTCNDARSDTFQLEIISSGRISNAGTDQMLLCNVTSTNLAGSLPSASGGVAGFWKFLPSISTNTINAPVMADSTNRTTLVSGFTNLSSNYFSWNVTDGNSGSYCALRPDTVLIVYSGTPPSTIQHAQPDFFGTLPQNGNYMLRSNAITPTFNVQWNKISGVGSTIVNPNNQNTNVTGLTAGNYVFELVVTNACGIFKDTVNLYFAAAGNLPVTLISFNGNRKNETTDMLIWQVADEINMKNYEVQISDNGFDFKKIGTVATVNSSSNNKTYDFANTAITNSFHYYKLKMINLDGSFAYSNILKLSNKQKNINTLEVVPNPARANLFVHINAAVPHLSTIEIINPLGQPIFKKNIQTIKGMNTIPLDVSNLPRGMFLLKVDDMIQKLILE